MENQKLTQRPQAPALTENALIHVVEPFDISQGADGSSYKFPAANLFMAGQDNIDIRKYVTIGEQDNLNTIVSKINALPQYAVSEKQSVWFIATQGNRSIPGLYSPERVLKFKMMNKGKGIYGLGATQLTGNDIELVYSNEEGLSDIETDPVTDIVNFGELDSEVQHVSQWLNSQDSEIVIQPQNEGYTLFQGMVDMLPTSYLWIGSPGVYGLGEQQSSYEDFQTLDDTIPQYDNNAPFIRNVGLIEILPVAQGLREKLNSLTTIITPIDTPVLFTCYTLGETGAGTAHTFLFLGGKGTWGAGGSHVFGAMLYPLLEKPINTGEIEDDDSTQIIPLGEVEEGGFLEAANAEEHDLTDIEHQYYFSYYVGDVLYLALFTEGPGIYGGETGTDFIESDFAQVTNGNITGVPTLQQVNADGGGTIDPLVVTGVNGKLAHFSDGMEFSGTGMHTQKSTFKETAHDSVYSHPTDKAGEQTYAMVSDLSLQKVLEGGSMSNVSANISLQSNPSSGVGGTLSIIDGKILIGSSGDMIFSTGSNITLSCGGNIALNNSGNVYVSNQLILNSPPSNENSAVTKSYVDTNAAAKADLEDGKVPDNQLPPNMAPCNFGKIIKIGKGFTVNSEGVVTPNSGSMSSHEKGDLFKGVSAGGKYIPYMRYNGIGDVNDFANHHYDLEINALLPDEPGYLLIE